MKKLSLLLIVFGLAMIPAALIAQPPRPYYPGQMLRPQPHAMQTHVVSSVARPTMQVSTPPRPMPVHASPVIVQRPPVIVHRPPVMVTAPYPSGNYTQPVVTYSTPVQPRIVVSPVYVPTYPQYYTPAGSGFSLTIGGPSGVFSIATAR